MDTAGQRISRSWRVIPRLRGSPAGVSTDCRCESFTPKSPISVTEIGEFGQQYPFHAIFPAHHNRPGSRFRGSNPIKEKIKSEHHHSKSFRLALLTSRCSEFLAFQPRPSLFRPGYFRSSGGTLRAIHASFQTSAAQCVRVRVRCALGVGHADASTRAATGTGAGGGAPRRVDARTVDESEVHAEEAGTRRPFAYRESAACAVHGGGST